MILVLTSCILHWQTHFLGNLIVCKTLLSGDPSRGLPLISASRECIWYTCFVVYKETSFVYLKLTICQLITIPRSGLAGAVDLNLLLSRLTHTYHISDSTLKMFGGNRRAIIFFLCYTTGIASLFHSKRQLYMYRIIHIHLPSRLWSWDLALESLLI